MRQLKVYLVLCLPAIAVGCITSSESNPFLTLTESFATARPDNSNSNSGSGGGSTADDQFRQTMTVVLANNNQNERLNTLFVAWVNASSIRSAEQQDALLRDNYVQLTREVRLGTAFVLPTGTFVRNGSGVAGATVVSLPPATGGAITTQTINLLTPDVVLIMTTPPTTCDDVAFFYSTAEGESFLNDPIAFQIFGGATSTGNQKTYAQMDGYHCAPFRQNDNTPLLPGYFLKLGGGARNPNEYFEGEDMRVDFFAAEQADGDFTVLTISE
ncbi:MAG: hypothetical protein JNG88_18245 [Phycisphaerales bacterium]|nr:hypothetical protein [Phycisphaerales bacterium]